jgi:hypothetical protein
MRKEDVARLGGKNHTAAAECNLPSSDILQESGNPVHIIPTFRSCRSIVAISTRSHESNVCTLRALLWEHPYQPSISVCKTTISENVNQSIKFHVITPVVLDSFNGTAWRNHVRDSGCCGYNLSCHIKDLPNISFRCSSFPSSHNINTSVSSPS